jgi:hypothetical protein
MKNGRFSNACIAQIAWNKKMSLDSWQSYQGVI